MPVLIVVNSVREWPFDIPGVAVVDAKSYLTKPDYGDVRGAKVFNLCRSYRYQSLGYYVTLLATARGHKPLPNIMTIQDMKSQTVVRFVSDDLDDLIQNSLAPIESNKFTLSIYFGRNLARRYDRLSLHLFNLFQAPLLRAQFMRNSKWQLRQIGPVPVDDIPSQHRSFVLDVATEHFSGRRPLVRSATRRNTTWRYWSIRTSLCRRRTTRPSAASCAQGKPAGCKPKQLAATIMRGWPSSMPCSFGKRPPWGTTPFASRGGPRWKGSSWSMIRNPS